MISPYQQSSAKNTSRDQRTIAKYLSTYAEPESCWNNAQLDSLPSEGWDYVVTIPACGEDQYLPGALESINNSQVVRSGARVVCIVVLNGNEAREMEFRESNQRMRSWFRKQCTTIAASLNPNGTCPQRLVSWQDIEILIIDRSEEPWLIPADQGVGLVRKIGADLALLLIAEGIVKDSWIHATDADARVPDDYFLRTSEQPVCPGQMKQNTSYFIYPYQHIPDPEMDQQEHNRYWPALTDYELWLRYYVAGLEWAGSSYAYPSIGSLLAFDALTYAKIRGFPKRMAGEDFYFQNKLVKMGAVIILKGQPIKLLTRPSTRVPFGTGQGTKKIEQLNETGFVYEVYNPAVFYFLKGFLAAVRDWFLACDSSRSDRERNFLATTETFYTLSNLNKEAFTAWLGKLVSELNLFKHLDAASKRSKSPQGAIHQFDDWFDGFQTLKLIHRLRDELFGSLPLLEALQASEFLLNPAHENMRGAWLEKLRSGSVLSDQ